MTPGQELALEQLRAIQEADPLAFEVIHTRPIEGRQDILVTVSISCRGIKCRPEGLPLRERERFVIWVPPAFPFVKPDIWVPHKRFAGRAHVQWEQHLCLYQAPQTEWDYSDGMFGYIRRLWVWLEHGARNEPDPEGQPIHPPVAYTGESKLVIVPRADTPLLEGQPWFGFAHLDAINARAFAITSWHAVSADEVPPPPVAPVILLPQNLPWEMPQQMGNLCAELERSGVTKQKLIALFQLAMIGNPKDHPFFVVVGSPQRGVQSTGLVKQHLMAWQVMDLMLHALDLSADTLRSIFELSGATATHQVEYRQKLLEIQAKAERIAVESFQLVKVNWCSILEDRPEVTKRRDGRSLMDAFRNKSLCLWGCGALGSHVAYFLVKAGVKKLILLDKATVKPGLLVRQMFGDSEIGEWKATALKRRLDSLGSHVEIEAVPADVHTELDGTTDWTRSCDLVIDCTAADTIHAKMELAWAAAPKKAPVISMIVGHRAERGIVTVISPGYRGALKDVFRKAKLAACQKPALAAFADDFYPKGNDTQFFQPEPGCSDATFEGSCSDVTGLSAMMLNAAAQALRQDLTDSATAAFICQPHIATTESGQSAFTEFKFPSDFICKTDYEIRLSKKAWKEMAAVIRESRRKRGPTPETGGLLFGKRDDALRIIWIDDAIGPPPDSICRPEKFVCGVQGTQEAHAKRAQRSRGSTEFIGMWHTHPRDLPLPSQTDLSGMAQLLTSGEAPPLRSLMLIVGWVEDEVMLGTSVFDRRMFANGQGSVVVAATHVPSLKL